MSFSAPRITRRLTHRDQAACPVWDKRPVTAADFHHPDGRRRTPEKGSPAGERPPDPRWREDVGMLVLTRKVGEAITVGDDIRITVVEIRAGKVRLGIAAPGEVVVDRQEVHERRRDLLGGWARTGPLD